jgi:hypothetical protein
VRALESELEGKDRELKQGFDEQRRFHELIRIEKDKYLNLEIQCRSLKMELEMLEKDKTNEINRLIRDFENRDGHGDKEIIYKMKKLEEEIRERDRRYHELLIEKERRKEKETEVVSTNSKGDKNYLEELLEKNRSMSENSSKAIADGMNMIFTKMSELERRNEEKLKAEIEEIRRRVEEDNRRKNSSEFDREKEKEQKDKGFYDRVGELEAVNHPLDRFLSEKWRKRRGSMMTSWPSKSSSQNSRRRIKSTKAESGTLSSERPISWPRSPNSKI